MFLYYSLNVLSSVCRLYVWLWSIFSYILIFQETFRACADIRILKERNISPVGSGALENTFTDDTHFKGGLEFEDYYDELFSDSEENNIDYLDFQNSIR